MNLPGRATDPIVAVATAPGRSAVGIVRVSGNGLRGFARALLGRELKARAATYLPFADAQGKPLDHGLALYFDAPHSFTGEDVLELQAHGGPVLLQLLLRRCLEVAQTTNPASGAPVLPRLRLARPGEFTERAFLNDKIDLTQAEAVADLIDASTETAVRAAARSLAGEFSAEVVALLDALTRLRMLVEATLDFPEEDIAFLQKADAKGQLQALLDRLATLRLRSRQGALLREGIKVVIAGQPNVGKSSLLNALAGTELAIVTPIPGTTRDKVQQTIQIEGVPLHVIDTAGLHDTDEVVEKIGVLRAWGAIADADAVLFVHDLTRAGDDAYLHSERQIATELSRTVSSRAQVLQLWNKLDLVVRSSHGGPALPLDIGNAGAVILLSTKTGEGLSDLRQALLSVVGWRANAEGHFMARDRHLQALGRVQAHVEAAAGQLAHRAPALELLAEELRLAQVALGEITGAFNSDDLLGAIFSNFCIGK
jgi:tRNA modification GTPase